MDWIQKHVELGLLILVMTLATVLRFWNFLEIPFTYDEYSSFFRASQDSYAQVLETGILTDAHPAFLHSFLFFWIQVVGDSIPLIKLPFILASIAAVWLTYVLGKRWFGVNVGLLAATLLTVAEFPLMYSQIARPYSIGLFVSMAMLWQWDNFIQSPTKKSGLCLALIFAAGAYVHHFVALHGLILLVLAYFFLKPKARRHLILVAGTGILLYLPQLMITLEQLKFKGIGSILPPVSLSFIGHHLGYVANFDWLFGLVLLFILGISSAHWNKEGTARKWALLLIWLLPLVAGLLYSLLVAPIIQDRVLVFALPALFLLISSGVQWINVKIGRVIVIVTCLIGTFSTVVNRNYFELFYTDCFSHVAQLAFTPDNSQTAKLLAYHPPIFEFQDKKQVLSSPVMLNPDSTWAMQDFCRTILTNEGDDFMYGWTTQFYLPPFETMALLRERYNCLKNRKSFNHGDFQYWSSAGDRYIPDFSDMMDLKVSGNGWSFPMEKVDSDSIADFLKMGPLDEWGVKFSRPLNAVTSDKRSVIFASIELSSVCMESLLVMEIVGPSGQMHWSANPFSDFLTGNERGWVHVATPLSEISYLPEDAIFNTFVWNKGACDIQIFNAEIWIDNGLDKMYSLDHPF